MKRPHVKVERSGTDPPCADTNASSLLINRPIGMKNMFATQCSKPALDVSAASARHGEARSDEDSTGRAHDRMRGIDGIADTPVRAGSGR